MQLTLRRTWKKDTYTVGNLYVDGLWFCNTMEDKDRGLKKTWPLSQIQKYKVKDETAIPIGTYAVTMKVQSPKYVGKKQYEKCDAYIPRVLNVPAFDGILIHIGNYAKDSYGCILLGENKVKGAVVKSTEWFWKFYDILKAADDAGKDIYLTVQP